MQTTQIPDVFSPEELELLWSLPEVTDAQNKLSTRSQVYFTVSLPDSIKTTLTTRLGIDLSHVTTVPMRWIKGDSAPHIDRGVETFDKTYLLYMNDCPGELIVDGTSYPMQANTAYVFNEGLGHETRGATGASRLLLGPMSASGFAVGAPSVYYYANYADAVADNNLLTYGINYPYVVGDVANPAAISAYTSWRLAPNTTGTDNQALVYPNGYTLNSNGLYYLYPVVPCFLEGTKLLCFIDGVETYKPIEEIRKGTLVKTSLDGYKEVVMIGKGTLNNPGDSERTENRLYKCSKDNYPELTEDLYITGCHSILVDELTEVQREKTKQHLGRIFVTDRKYRLIAAAVDERAEPWNSEGSYTIWHLALAHTDEAMNYGVYANGGLLVETCCIKFMRDKSNMELLN